MTSRWCLAAVMAVASSFVVSSAAQGQHTHGEAARPAAQPRAAAAVAPIKPAPAGALPALPRVPFPPARPMAVVQQVYEFAARHPDVSRTSVLFGLRSAAGIPATRCFVKAGRQRAPHRMGPAWIAAVAST